MTDLNREIIVFSESERTRWFTSSRPFSSHVGNFADAKLEFELMQTQGMIESIDVFGDRTISVTVQNPEQWDVVFQNTLEVFILGTTGIQTCEVTVFNRGDEQPFQTGSATRNKQGIGRYEILSPALV